MIIPAHFTPYKRAVLEKPHIGWHIFPQNLKDILINVVGFIPLGFLFVENLKHRGFMSVAAIVIAVPVGSAISLRREILPAFLLSRSSDMVDLIANTIGTMIGCWVLMVKDKGKKEFKMFFRRREE